MTSYLDYLKRADDKKHYIFHCRARDPVTGGLGYGAAANLTLFAPLIIFVVLLLLLYIFSPNGELPITQDVAVFIIPLLFLSGFALMFAYLNHKTKGYSSRFLIAMLKNKSIIYEHDGKIVGEMKRFTPIKPVTTLYPKGALVTIKIKK